MSKRLALHGYVSAKKLQEKKEEKELEHCTFSPQINPYSEQLASNELERYIDKTIRPVPEGLLERSEDTTEESHPATWTGVKCSTTRHYRRRRWPTPSRCNTKRR
ncbi:hypothetical protein AGDE_14915 [Angomonas deanei]|uniref:Uncharacterized protein n=1 Tax=Angomonas deanei TaxID=59799 RepID=A0A7G2C371_9TRYP|nr:hypothetical protein AGDE_14915 [Angomonas deanei]CAD2214248.1 hypothetical protein, conserved [Angomonas deanei]|eukprot:EPY20000.1 hypothetical protein AGDE_14915 [Angomonas deanei]